MYLWLDDSAFPLYTFHGPIQQTRHKTVLNSHSVLLIGRFGRQWRAAMAILTRERYACCLFTFSDFDWLLSRTIRHFQRITIPGDCKATVEVGRKQWWICLVLLLFCANGITAPTDGPWCLVSALWRGPSQKLSPVGTVVRKWYLDNY